MDFAIQRMLCLCRDQNSRGPVMELGFDRCSDFAFAAHWGDSFAADPCAPRSCACHDTVMDYDELNWTSHDPGRDHVL